MDIKELYQELIIDHGTQPRNCCSLADANQSAQGFNPLCGDKVQVFLKINHHTIEKASFTGSGCAISMASASLMTEALIGNRIENCQQLSQSFQDLLTQENPPPAELGKLAALSGVKAYPARVKCATLPWHTLAAALQQESKIVSTE